MADWGTSATYTLQVKNHGILLLQIAKFKACLFLGQGILHLSCFPICKQFMQLFFARMNNITIVISSFQSLDCRSQQFSILLGYFLSSVRLLSYLHSAILETSKSKDSLADGHHNRAARRIGQTATG